MHPISHRAFRFFPLTLLLAAGAALSAELPAGTVLDKNNLEKVKNDIFQGHTIDSLLTEKVVWQIKQWGLKITLDPAKPIPVDPHLLQATEKYAGQVKLDPASREVTGYVAGIPFPKIEQSDPAAGDKIMWNFYYASQIGETVYNKYFMLTVSADKGVETKQSWIFQRFYFKNRLGGDKPVVGDGSVLAKTFNLGQY